MLRQFATAVLTSRLGLPPVEASNVIRRMHYTELMQVCNANRKRDEFTGDEQLVALLYRVETRGDLLGAPEALQRGKTRLAFSKLRLGTGSPT